MWQLRIENTADCKLLVHCWRLPANYAWSEREEPGKTNHKQNLKNKPSSPALIRVWPVQSMVHQSNSLDDYLREQPPRFMPLETPELRVMGVKAAMWTVCCLMGSKPQPQVVKCKMVTLLKMKVQNLKNNFLCHGIDKRKKESQVQTKEVQKIQGTKEKENQTNLMFRTE